MRESFAHEISNMEKVSGNNSRLTYLKTYKMHFAVLLFVLALSGLLYALLQMPFSPIGRAVGAFSSASPSSSKISSFLLAMIAAALLGMLFIAAIALKKSMKVRV